MNIHFSDEILFEKLIKATIFKAEIGSYLYQVNNEKSDKDYLYIYATSDAELNSFLVSHHQLQFKKDNVDYNFVSLHTFIRNLLSGDSTINLEIIYSDQLINTPLEFLNKYKNYFCNYTIIRSYLGMTRRDIRFYNKSIELNYRQKRLKHIIRGALFAKSLINNDFNVVNSDFINICKQIDEINDIHDLFVIREQYVDMINELRNYINDNINKYTRYIKPENQAVIDYELQNLMKLDSYKSAKISDFNDYMHYFYNAYENWVEYEN